MSTTDEKSPVERGCVLRCEQLVVGFGGQGLLPPIDLELCRGDLVAVVGRNGSGKTTWLKTVLGLAPAVAGQVVRSPELKAAYVPQVGALDPLLPLRARDVVAWGRLSGWSFARPLATGADRRACEAALARAGAVELAARRFRQLSEGQRQRVLLARLLASEAELAVLDEPTSAMDPVAERAAIDALAELARERRVAVVIVSHMLDLVARHADRVLFLDRDHRAVHWGAAREVFADPHFRSHFGDVTAPHAD